MARKPGSAQSTAAPNVGLDARLANYRAMQDVALHQDRMLWEKPAVLVILHGLLFHAFSQAHTVSWLHFFAALFLLSVTFVLLVSGYRTVHLRDSSLRQARDIEKKLLLPGTPLPHSLESPRAPWGTAHGWFLLFWPNPTQEQALEIYKSSGTWFLLLVMKLLAWADIALVFYTLITALQKTLH